MIKLPTVIGLKLCQQAIVEEKTRNVTLVNCLRELSVASFPARIRPLTACIVLSDGMGEGKLSLTIASLGNEDMPEIWTGRWNLTLKNPVKEHWLFLPVENLVLTYPGRYQVALTIDQEPIARTVLEVTHKKG